MCKICTPFHISKMPNYISHNAVIPSHFNNNNWYTSYNKLLYRDGDRWSGMPQNIKCDCRWHFVFELSIVVQRLRTFYLFSVQDRAIWIHSKLRALLPDHDNSLRPWLEKIIYFQLFDIPHSHSGDPLGAQPWLSRIKIHQNVWSPSIKTWSMSSVLLISLDTIYDYNVS